MNEFLPLNARNLPDGRQRMFLMTGWDWFFMIFEKLLIVRSWLNDWLDCTEEGTSDSLSSSEDRFDFLDFSIICSSDTVQYVCSQNAFNYCTIKINQEINFHIVWF